MFNKCLEEITVDKELILSLPRNNIKNIKKLIIKCDELEKKYQEDLKLILEEMKKRYQNYTNIAPNDELEKMERQYNELFNKLYLLDSKETYEKSGLSKYIYELERFFNSDLENVNEIIKKILQTFENVGINLSISDFTYSLYTNIYMKEIFNNSSNNDIKNIFDDIYFKSPSLFKQISLNFKSLYYKNQKKFIDYYNSLAGEFIMYSSPEEIYKDFFYLQIKLNEEKIQDRYLNLNNFLTGKSQIKDYTKEQINKYYQMFTEQEITSNNILEINEVINKFVNSIKEYKGYLKYNYIIIEIKKIYSEKDKYKNISSNKYKEINKKQAKLFKINKKIEHLMKKNNNRYKDKIDIMLNEVENLIDEISVLYEEYEENLFIESICNLPANTTLFDILKISTYNYRFIVNLIKKNNEELTINEINSYIKELENYLKTTKFSILNYVDINDTKEIDYIIIDKYNLLGLNLKKEQLEYENIDNLINIGNIITNSYYVLKQFNLETINFIIEYLKIKNNL